MPPKIMARHRRPRRVVALLRLLGGTRARGLLGALETRRNAHVVAQLEKVNATIADYTAVAAATNDGGRWLGHSPTPNVTSSNVILS